MFRLKTDYLIESNKTFARTLDIQIFLSKLTTEQMVKVYNSTLL